MVTPTISEFSYGFALTNELVGLMPLTAAPIFPSLIEEGRAGGGYDVKLNAPGIPLYLQFKRSYCMTRRSANEIKLHGAALRIPFYRFYIMEGTISNQHAMLLQLDDGINVVYYAAPRFHRIEEIDHAWATNEVGTQSIFVRPGVIGPLDPGEHHVAFDETHTYVCSRPVAIPALTLANVVASLSARLAAETLPIGERLPSLLAESDRAFRAGIEAMAAASAARKQRDLFFKLFSGSTMPVLRGSGPLNFPARSEPQLDSRQSLLRDLADKAAAHFGAQLLIVQSKF